MTHLNEEITKENEDDIIAQVVMECLAAGWNSLTSVEVSNEIKRGGIWISASRVRDWLHSNGEDFPEAAGYRKFQRTVEQLLCDKGVPKHVSIWAPAGAAVQTITGHSATTPDGFLKMFGIPAEQSRKKAQIQFTAPEFWPLVKDDVQATIQAITTTAGTPAKGVAMATKKTEIPEVPIATTLIDRARLLKAQISVLEKELEGVKDQLKGLVGKDPGSTRLVEPSGSSCVVSVKRTISYDQAVLAVCADAHKTLFPRYFVTEYKAIDNEMVAQEIARATDFGKKLATARHEEVSKAVKF